MSQMKLENIVGLVPIESIPPEDGLVRTQPVQTESFGDHLRRAGTLPGETAAAGGPDSARPSSSDAPAEGSPQAAADPQDSADALSDDDLTADGSPEDAAETEPSETSETKTDAAEDEPSETAEAGSQDEQEDEADADAEPGGAQAVQSGPVAGHALPEDAVGQIAEDAVGQVAEDHGEQTAAARTAAHEQANNADARGKTPRRQAVTEGSLSTESVAEEGMAAGKQADASGKNSGKQTDSTTQKSTGQTVEPDQPSPGASAGRSRDRSGQQGEGAGEASDQGREAKPSARRAGLPRHDSTTSDTNGDAVGQQVGGQPTQTAAITAAAVNAAADARAGSRGQPPSADEETAQSPEEAAKPASSPAPDSQLNAPLRLSSDQRARPGSTQQSPEPAEPGPVDRAQFVRRVERAFRAIGRHSGSVRLRLSPPELGSLRLEITVRDGMMTARVEAETTTARNLLLDNLPALRDRLAQQDIKVKQFDVSLTGQSPGGLPDQTANQAESHHRGGGTSTPQADRDADRDTRVVPDPGAAHRPGEGTQLNVVI